MAASTKFELSSGSPDRPSSLYASGQRGSYKAAASFERSSSFRENMENPVSSSALPSTSSADVISFFQCLRFDPKSIISDHKLNRQGEFKRIAGLALGDDSTPSPSPSPSNSVKGKLPPDELKRFRLGLHESTIKARERVKMFNEGLLVINKCFPNISSSRKRSRSDVLSGERSNAFFVSDRSVVLGGGVSKMGAQSHTVFELEQHKPEERSKNAVPNKRTRTSMVDPWGEVRPNTPARTSCNVDKDKEGLRLPNSGAAQGEDRTLSMGVDGWEKSKMKKKRSVIKADMASSSVATKPIDGYKELKQEKQPRLISDGRPRLSDSSGLRQGSANGIVVKADGTSQQSVLGMRSSVLRSDQDSSSAVHERRDQTSNLDKERANAKAVNKINAREEISSASPTSSAKLNIGARAPRSGSGSAPKLSPVMQRATAANDWELSSCTNKNSAALGTGNRKRTPATRSSSPPVAQWASHRPQKMSRTARRTNFVPIVSSNHETPSVDSISDVAGNENGSVFTKRLSGNSPRPVILKGDHFPSATLSESEESGAAEVKSRDKNKRSDNLDDKSGQNVQKVSTLVVPVRKNKVANREDLGDGIRRQGRSGRGSTSTRSPSPMTIEKHGNIGTAKQLRSAELGLEKPESKAGRPPTRKLSDRKAYTRQKHTTVNAAADFLVGSDDGHEELLAAANAVTSLAYAFSSSFWKQMEPLFGFISDVDMTYLKQKSAIGSIAATPNTAPLDNALDNGIGMTEQDRDMTETKYSDLSLEYLAPGAGMSGGISLCQILLASLISEDVNEGNDEAELNVYGSNRELDGDTESGTFNYRSVQSFELAGRTAYNGYRTNSIGRSYNELEHNLSEKDILSRPDMWISSGFDHFQNGFIPDQAVIPVLSYSDIQYNKMSLNERALLEIQSIGLSPEPVPDLAQTGDEEISQDISRLEEKYHDKVCRKKILLDRLLKCASEARELQEKEFEQSALDKLIGMAYQKFMSCRGSNAHGGKSSSGKMAKQAALAFVKRTLERCKQFEFTGKSCFSEPLFREIFLSRLSQFSDSRQIYANTDGESGKFYVNASGSSVDGISAPVGIQQSPSVSNNDIYSSGALLSVNTSSERNIGKEDTWSNRVKKRELLLDDVVGGVVGTSSCAPSGIGNSLLSSAKGKRSERDREGKGNSRELSRNGPVKDGRTASGNAKAERKSKAKPKQKITQLSAVNGLIAKMTEQPRSGLSSIPNSGVMNSSSSSKEKENFNLDVLDNPEAIDLSNMDVLDVPDDLGGQGEDIGSWLCIDDDGLQDNDFMGLEIPMDDLSELNMMV